MCEALCHAYMTDVLLWQASYDVSHPTVKIRKRKEFPPTNVQKNPLFLLFCENMRRFYGFTTQFAMWPLQFILHVDTTRNNHYSSEILQFYKRIYNVGGYIAYKSLRGGYGSVGRAAGKLRRPGERGGDSGKAPGKRLRCPGASRQSGGLLLSRIASQYHRRRRA